MAAVLSAGLAVSEGRHVCLEAISYSTHAFCEYFQALRTESLNPVERVVFSIALTRAKVHHAAKPPLRS